ncbi:hypothetical protein CYMTET_28303 [Cymbomonas tetramitiformis]|uniref:Uncharacterized protein n=1 Tax=Cymbomonas tetramitiformis TaxID=36881 RepID=A0AAE0FN80_9CHLO|nr:hypothetical protein CYMTET_28303 [Cymbomonas tetramitiformis]
MNWVCPCAQLGPVEEVIAVQRLEERGRPREVHAQVLWHDHTTTWEPVTGIHSNPTIHALPMFRNFIMRANRPVRVRNDLPLCGHGPWSCVVCAMAYNPADPNGQREAGVVDTPPRRRLRLNGCRACLCWECYQGIMNHQRRTARRCPVCNRYFEHPGGNWDEEPIPEELFTGVDNRLAQKLAQAGTAEEHCATQRLIDDMPRLIAQQTRLRQLAGQ